MEISGQCQQLIHCTDILVFMSGDLAIATGVPIHAVVAAVPIATDDVGRLFPGQGVLTSVCYVVKNRFGARDQIFACRF